MRAAAFPISIDAAGFDELARRPEIQARAREIREALGNPKTVLLGVDRLDYTKGILHRLKAYGELLEEGRLGPPEAVLVQVASPSRERVEQYLRLRDEVESHRRADQRGHRQIGHPARPLPPPVLPARGDGGAVPGGRRDAGDPACATA